MHKMAHTPDSLTKNSKVRTLRKPLRSSKYEKNWWLFSRALNPFSSNYKNCFFGPLEVSFSSANVIHSVGNKGKFKISDHPSAPPSIGSSSETSVLFGSLSFSLKKLPMNEHFVWMSEWFAIVANTTESSLLRAHIPPSIVFGKPACKLCLTGKRLKCFSLQESATLNGLQNDKSSWVHLAKLTWSKRNRQKEKKR